MQPDLPEPVVPAISRCGMRARSVQTALPEMSLPSQTESGLDGRRQVVVDVAQGDEVRREVRHLDAHGLLAGDRREDADLGRRERVGEVVLERRDLRDLRPRGELELVARDARARRSRRRPSRRRRSSRAPARAGPATRAVLLARLCRGGLRATRRTSGRAACRRPSSGSVASKSDVWVTSAGSGSGSGSFAVEHEQRRWSRTTSGNSSTPSTGGATSAAGRRARRPARARGACAGAAPDAAPRSASPCPSGGGMRPRRRR